MQYRQLQTEKKIFCPKTGEISAENRKICAKTVAGHVSSEEVPLPDASPGRRQTDTSPGYSHNTHKVTAPDISHSSGPRSAKHSNRCCNTVSQSSLGRFRSPFLWRRRCKTSEQLAVSSEQLVGIRKCLCRSGSRSQPRQGPKPGRKRRWRGFPGAPSGAGRGVSPRVPRIVAELGAWSRPRPADEARGRRVRGDMFGRGSYALVRRCKSSIFSVAIRSAVEVSASSLTHWCSSEVPLDAARCRCSVHWREGGSARRCASRGMVRRIRG